MTFVLLILAGCSENSTEPELKGSLAGKVTIDGQGIDGVIIDVSAFQISGGQGNGKVFKTIDISEAGDYSIELSAGIYRADFAYYGFGDEDLTAARYPIIIMPDSETVVDVELKDPIPRSFLVIDGNAAVELSWESSYDAISYRLYRADSTGYNFQMIAQVDTGSGTIYHTDYPSMTGDYYYYVTAIYGEGDESGYEAIRQIDFTGSIRPPTGLVALDLVDYVQLNWNECDRAQYYRIYRSRLNNHSWIVIDSTSVDHYDDLPPDTAIYYYRLTAMSDYGTESAPGAAVSVNFDGRFDPPQELAIVDRGSSLYLSWLEYANVHHYSIYRSTDITDDFRLVNTTLNNYYDDVPVDTGTYYYYVTASAANDIESEPSAIVSSSYDGVLDFPSGFVAINRGLYVELGWEEVSWAGAYLIFRSTDGEIYIEVARVAGGVTSYNDSPTYADLYYYRIASETMTGTMGELSEPVEVLYTANLLAPTGVIAENLGTSIRISWDLHEDADGYKLYRARSENDSYEYLDSTLETFFIDIPSEGGAYYYKVRAFDSLGHQSPLSMSAYVHFDDRPLPPYDVVVVDSLYKVYLWWESIETEAEYAVYRSITMDSDYLYIQTVSALSAFDWPSSAGSYFYKIRTIVDYDTSDYSEFRHVVFSGILQPPSDITAADIGTHIHVTWAEPDGASYYEVYRSDSVDGEYIRIMTVYEDNADDAPETAGTYFYKIKAFTQGDLPSLLSDSVEVDFEP